MSRWLVAMVSLLACAGCGEAVLRSGLPAGNVPSGYDAHWHDSFVFGMVEGENPEPLTTICPRGWSEIRTETPLLAALLSWGTLGIYTPTSVTVVCAAPSGVYIGAPGEVPLPPLCR